LVVCHGPGTGRRCCGIRFFRPISRYAEGGPMSARQQLKSYLERLEKRLRIGATVRGAALFTSVALIATVVLVLIANSFAFSGGSIISARIILVLALIAAAVLGIAWPLSGLNVRRTARKAEDVFPDFNQRLLTFAERDDNKDP